MADNDNDIVQWSAAGIKEFQRVRRKIDSISGPGVNNSPDTISIYPPPLPRLVPRSADQPLSVKFATATADWTPGNAYIMATPEEGGSPVQITLIRPDGAPGTPPDFCGYATDSIIPYLEFSDGSGTARLAIENPPPRITEQGQVWQAAAYSPTNVVAQQLRIYT